MKPGITKRRSSVPPTPAPVRRRRSRAERAVAEQFMSLLKVGKDARRKKIKRVRQSVKSRSYENDLKLSVALDRLAQELMT